MKPSEQLRAAKNLILNPENWIQGDYARDSEGGCVRNSWHKDAMCWCSLGAIENIGKAYYSSIPATHYLIEASQRLINDTVSTYNDIMPHFAVM